MVVGETSSKKDTWHKNAKDKFTENKQLLEKIREHLKAGRSNIDEFTESRRTIRERVKQHILEYKTRLIEYKGLKVERIE